MKKNKEKTIVFCFGGFRIITQAHNDLFLETLDTAVQFEADCHIWLSSAEKSKYFALSGDQKKKYVTMLLSDRDRKVLKVTDDSTRTPAKVIDYYLKEKFTKIIFVAGSDRYDLAEQLKMQIGDLAAFLFVEFERSNDISASRMKDAIMSNDEAEFCDLCPEAMPYWAKILMFMEAAIGLKQRPRKTPQFNKRIEQLKQQQN